jgi:hypothetical protein
MVVSQTDDTPIQIRNNQVNVAMIMSQVVDCPVGGGAMRRLQLQTILNQLTEGRASAWDLSRGVPRQLSNLKAPLSNTNCRHELPAPRRQTTMVRAAVDTAALALHLYPMFTMRRLTGEDRRRILDWIDYDQPTHVVLEHPYTTELTPILNRRQIKVVIECQNVESDLAGQLVAFRPNGHSRFELLALWRTILRWERRLLPMADQVWLPSPHDVVRQRQISRSRVRALCIPNALDLSAYCLRPAEPAHDIVFPGQFVYGPNMEAARILSSKVLPEVQEEVPDARVVLVGRDPLGHALSLQRTPDIVVTGEVPDTKPYLQSAAVIAVPLLHGSGTRFKILEALALGRPVVATSLGAEGLDVRDGVHLLIRETAAFPEAIVSLLRDIDYGRRLGQAGRKLVEEKYSWNAVSRLIREALTCPKDRR